MSPAILFFLVATVCLVVIGGTLIGSKSRSRIPERFRAGHGGPAAQSGPGEPPPSNPTAPAPVAVPGLVTRRAPVKEEGKRSTANKVTMKDRLIQAGLYHERLAKTFADLRLVLMTIPMLLCLALAFLGVFPMKIGFLIGTIATLAGTVGPSFWLDRLKAKRQSKLRRALPDALDIIIVCVEGGLGLNAALARVGNELAIAHPLLASELRIVDREIRMGRTTSQALKELAARFDLEEIRSLASVVNHAERFGASIVKALVVYAETMRLRRQQNAEERGHKAVVKLIFPTLLCVFPAMFVVLLGPAAIRIYHALTGPGGPVHG